MAKVELIKDDLSGDVIDRETKGNFVDGRPVDLYYEHQGKVIALELHLAPAESDMPDIQDISAKTVRQILTGAVFEKPVAPAPKKTREKKAAKE